MAKKVLLDNSSAATAPGEGWHGFNGGEISVLCYGNFAGDTVKLQARPAGAEDDTHVGDLGAEVTFTAAGVALFAGKFNFAAGLIEIRAHKDGAAGDGVTLEIAPK